MKYAQGFHPWLMLGSEGGAGRILIVMSTCKVIKQHQNFRYTREKKKKVDINIPCSMLQNKHNSTVQDIKEIINK